MRVWGSRGRGVAPQLPPLLQAPSVVLLVAVVWADGWTGEAVGGRGGAVARGGGAVGGAFGASRRVGGGGGGVLG